MASTSFLPSTQFLSSSNPKLAVHSKSKSQSPPTTTVNYRRQTVPGRISASYAGTSTMERTASSLYEVLGIQAGATCQEIKTAYRRLARVVHPDVSASTTGSCADEFIKIHAAYSTLSDPEKRADYDSSLFRAFKSQTISYSGYSSAPRRNWETDQCW